MSRFFLVFFFCTLILLGWGFALAQSTSQSSITYFIPQIIKKIPHRQEYFTQGVKIHQEKLYETTGLYGKSKLISYESRSSRSGQINNLKEKQIYHFSSDVFAEDLEIVGDRIYVLTWRENFIYVFDKNMNIASKLPYDREGWGIAYDGKYFITSDGSSTLTFREVKNLKPVKLIDIYYQNKPLIRINAIEVVNGKIYANVWFDNNIYVINPENGMIVGVIDCSILVLDNQKEIQKKYSTNNRYNLNVQENVLNGIAYDNREQVFYLTGKRWANFYKVKLKPRLHAR